MILVDTSVWIDFLRHGDDRVAELLERSSVLVHPCVIGELALGNLRNRDEVLGLLRDLPKAVVAEHDEVFRLIHDGRLHGCGIGYVDAHLLAACRLTSDARLWTHDKRLAGLAGRLDVDSGEAPFEILSVQRPRRPARLLLGVPERPIDDVERRGVGKEC